MDWIIPNFKTGSFGMYSGKYIDFYFSPRNCMAANSAIAPYFYPLPSNSSSILYVELAHVIAKSYNWSTNNYAQLGARTANPPKTVCGDCNDGFLMPIFGGNSANLPYGVFGYLAGDSNSLYLDGVPGQSDINIYPNYGWKGMTIGQARSKKYIESSWTDAVGYEVVVHYPGDTDKSTSVNYYWCPLVRATDGRGQVQFKYIPATAECVGWDPNIIDINTVNTTMNAFSAGAVSFIARREPDGTLTNLCPTGITNIWKQGEKTEWTMCETELNAGDEIVCILKPKTPPNRDTTNVGRLGMYLTNLTP